MAAVPERELPDLVGELARAQALAQVRLQPGPNGTRPQKLELDNYLSADQVAELLPFDRRWVYAHRRELGGVKVDGRVAFPYRRLAECLRALETESRR